jgi:hypothetical protein
MPARYHDLRNAETGILWTEEHLASMVMGGAHQPALEQKLRVIEGLAMIEMIGKGVGFLVM